MARLSRVEIDSALKSLRGWRRDRNYITKDFRFRTFLAGIGFVDSVARLAERLEHHPDIHVVYTTVTLRVQTHDQGGITEMDLDLASEIERALSRGKRKSARRSR